MLIDAQRGFHYPASWPDPRCPERRMINRLLTAMDEPPEQRFEQLLSIDPQYIPGLLSNFPVRVTHDHLDPAIFDHARPDGMDLQWFLPDSDIPLKREVVSFGAGDTQMYILMPLVAMTALTDVRVQYGSGVSIPNDLDTWDANYKLVTHDMLADSTVNGVIGALTNGGTIAPGYQGNGVRCDYMGNGIPTSGVKGMVTYSNPALFNPDTSKNLSCSYWAKVRKVGTTVNYGPQKWNNGGYQERGGWGFGHNMYANVSGLKNPRSLFGWSNNADYHGGLRIAESATDSCPDDVWALVEYGLEFYQENGMTLTRFHSWVNGQPQSIPVRLNRRKAGNFDGSQPLVFGFNDDANGQPWYASHLRIRDGIRSDAEVLATYNNWTQPGFFINHGEEDLLPALDQFWMFLGE